MHLTINQDELEALIDRVVARTVSKLDREFAAVGDRIGFPEPEAAALLGIARHVLRDCRLRGEIAGARIGKRVVYSREELLRLLRERAK